LNHAAANSDSHDGRQDAGGNHVKPTGFHL